MMNKARLRDKTKGMTLIEVLIASIVLFVAIGTVSGVQRVYTHYQQLNQLDYVLLMNQQSFFDYTQYSLERNIYSGSYRIGQYVLVWRSELEKEGNVINSFDPELNDNTSYSTSGRVKLFRVIYHFEHKPENNFEIKQIIANRTQTAPRI